MCYRTKLTKDISAIATRFEGKLESVPDLFDMSHEINGFALPKTPIVCTDAKKQLKIESWGYVESWSKVPILNAQFEQAHLKKTFHANIQNRCLIIVDGFYEWQWLDAKGKKKQKYLIQAPNKEIFFLLGQYKDVGDTDTGEVLRSYVIYTLAAKGIMEKIHNSKKRMPYATINLQDALAYLDGKDVEAFYAFDYEEVV